MPGAGLGTGSVGAGGVCSGVVNSGVGLSTSGNSPNVVKAIEAAKKIGMKTISLTGETGGKLDALCDICIKVPSRNTARIQETHILVGHILCQEIEEKIFSTK